MEKYIKMNDDSKDKKKFFTNLVYLKNELEKFINNILTLTTW